MASSSVSEITFTQDPAPINPEGKCATALNDLRAQGRIVHIVGQIVDGKVIIDQTALDDLAAKYPGATMSFSAVNAPFDPTHSVSLA